MSQPLQVGSSWSELVQIGSSWPNLVQAGPRWSKLALAGPNLPKLVQLVQAGPNWSKLVQARPSWPKLAQPGPSWSKLSVSKPEPSVSKPEPSVSKPEPRNPNPKRHAWPRAATELALAFKDVSKCPHARVRRALGFGHASASSTPSPDLEPLAPQCRARGNAAFTGVHEVWWRPPRGPAQFLNPCGSHCARTLTLTPGGPGGGHTNA